MTQNLQVQSESDRQIAALKTTPEANTLRNKIKAVQALAPKRLENFEVAFNGACSYCEVSAKAGKLWAELENKRPEGHQSTRENSLVISVTDAGFGDSHDATVCARVSELTLEERKAYYHKCQNDEKIPTLGGLYTFWRVKDREDLETPPLPEGKYRVIYADPPWFYNDKCDEGAIQSEGSESKYSSMTIDELCNLPIKELAQDDAVLFLWVTSPLLFECAPIIKAWGFEYKSSFVWDKVKHNMGHYNSVRHEFLLICTRGSCTPDSSELVDSVQSIDRTDHSVKPDEFRTIIDRLYTHGNKIELFARRPADGWCVWGNEIE